MDESLAGNVILVKDDYAVGPLDNIYETYGMEDRRQWWRTVLEDGDYAGKAGSGEVDDQKPQIT